MLARQVSVLIPTYKRYNRLNELLISLENQTFKNFEIIISDNTDKNILPPVYLNYFSTVMDIQYIRQEKNLGLMGNDKFLRSKGSADLVVMLHDDDSIPSNYLEELVSYMESHPNCSAVAGKGIRYLNGDFWYDYEEYSSLGLGYHSRIQDLIARFNGFYYSFEHFYYAMYRRKCLVNWDFIGLPFTTVLLFFSWSQSGYLHTNPNTFYIKSTTSEELANHLKSNYFIENSLIFTFLPRKIARRIIVGIFLVRISKENHPRHMAFIVLLFIWYSIFKSKKYTWRPSAVPINNMN